MLLVSELPVRCLLRRAAWPLSIFRSNEPSSFSRTVFWADKQKESHRKLLKEPFSLSRSAELLPVVDSIFSGGHTAYRSSLRLRKEVRVLHARCRHTGMAASAAYVAAIDQGTTSTRVIIYDANLKAVASHQLEHEQVHPRAGWVEHDPLEILEKTRSCMAESLLRAQQKVSQPNLTPNLKAIGITNQRETTVVWSRSTGLPLHNAIVWVDVRTSDICRRLEQDLPGGRMHFRDVTGLPISTYFSAVKLMWLLENVPAVGAAAEAGDALFGTVDTWLIWNLTGGAKGGGVHATDCSNASRTMLMCLDTLTWHAPTLEQLVIPASLLPRIVSNAEVVGRVAEGWPMAGVPIAGCLGDQHAAMLGQRCQAGQAKSTYGTGCFILLNTGTKRVPSEHGLLTTLAFKLGPSSPPMYALEGSIAIAGAAVQWLRDSLCLIKSAAEIEALAESVRDSGGVYFVPAFGGLFAPWWRDDARGVIVGITRYTNKGHIARATLEAICFQARAVLTAMQSDAEKVVALGDGFVLRVDGGATANNLLMQLQADLLGCNVVRPEDVETTALGAALAAGHAVGIRTSAEIFECRSVVASGNRTFTPQTEKDEREKRYASWCKAVERSFGLSDLA